MQCGIYIWESAGEDITMHHNTSTHSSYRILNILTATAILSTDSFIDPFIFSSLSILVTLAMFLHPLIPRGSLKSL